MAFKDVLLAITTYPEPTPADAVEDAVEFAAALGATISAVACEVKLHAPGSVLGNVLLDVPALVAAERKKSATNAQELLAKFQQCAERRGVFQDRIFDHCSISEVGPLLAEYARFRDLTIVPAARAGVANASFAESIVFGSGRPTLVMPSAPRRDKRMAPDTVVVAWDFSQPAARALADSLAILEKAKRVYVVTVTHEKVIHTRRSVAELATHLARHGVDAIPDVVDSAGRSIGQSLQSYVESRDADVLVMGAFGHSRLREFVLGGASRSMLSQPPVPVFLSH